MEELVCIMISTHRFTLRHDSNGIPSAFIFVQNTLLRGRWL